jgi:hypothetical protein
MKCPECLNTGQTSKLIDGEHGISCTNGHTLDDTFGNWPTGWQPIQCPRCGSLLGGYYAPRPQFIRAVCACSGVVEITVDKTNPMGKF